MITSPGRDRMDNLKLTPKCCLAATLDARAMPHTSCAWIPKSAAYDILSTNTCESIVRQHTASGPNSHDSHGKLGGKCY
eukprot:871666-Amphidinium_carterae.1